MINAVWANASKSFLARNPQLRGQKRGCASKAPQNASVRVLGASERKCPARVSGRTKAEVRALARIRLLHPGALVFEQPTGLFHLHGGGQRDDRYTPDFVVLGDGLPLLVVEVKAGYRGHGWEQGYERYKRAAAQWSDGRRVQFEMWTLAHGLWQCVPWRSLA